MLPLLLKSQPPVYPPFPPVVVFPPTGDSEAPGSRTAQRVDTAVYANAVANIQKSPALVHHYRAGVFLRRVNYTKLTIPFSLNEVREAEMTCPISDIFQFHIGDEIKIPSGDCVPETYSVNIVADDTQETGGGVTVTLDPEVGTLLRCAATSGVTVFDDLSVIATFQKIATYITEETGKVIPIVFVNPNNFNFGGRLNANGKNMLEVLRNLCGATGNSFRIRNGSLEIGQFGEASGIIFNGAGNDHNLGSFKWKSVLLQRDASEQTSAVYVEGGGYSKAGSNDNFTLLMGDDTTGKAPEFSTVPPGYALEIVTRNGKRYFRLSKVGAQGCTRAISISGVTPLGEDLVKDIYPAQQLLTDIAVKYLEIKSQQSIKVDVICPWTLCDIIDGQKVHVTIQGMQGGIVLDADMYVVAHEIRYSSDAIETAITMSNTLYDPDALLESSNQNTNKKGDKVPPVGVGTIAQSILFTAGITSPPCGFGRLATIDYSGARYTAVPTITLPNIPLYTLSLVSATKTSATICVTGSDYPVSGQIAVSGLV